MKIYSFDRKPLKFMAIIISNGEKKRKEPKYSPIMTSVEQNMWYSILNKNICPQKTKHRTTI